MSSLPKTIRAWKFIIIIEINLIIFSNLIDNFYLRERLNGLGIFGD
jgi:hypothetical protein